MSDVVKSDYYNENMRYKLFRVNIELLIDHSWGLELCTIEKVKIYSIGSNSFSSS